MQGSDVQEGTEQEVNIIYCTLMHTTCHNILHPKIFPFPDFYVLYVHMKQTTLEIYNNNLYYYIHYTADLQIIQSYVCACVMLHYRCHPTH